MSCLLGTGNGVPASLFLCGAGTEPGRCLLLSRGLVVGFYGVPLGTGPFPMGYPVSSTHINAVSFIRAPPWLTCCTELSQSFESHPQR